MAVALYWNVPCVVFGLILAFTTVTAQSTKCEHPKILSALKAQYENGSDAFCQQLLATVSMIGTLREDPTLFFYATKTNTKSTETVYAYAAITTKDRVTSTSYASQKRKPTVFVKPLPSYVQQYPTSAVTKACSCYIGPAETYTQYRPCEQAPTTTTYSSTFTITVGKPGAKTVTFTETFTNTRLKYATAPYPSTCPDADRVSCRSECSCHKLNQVDRLCCNGPFAVGARLQDRRMLSIPSSSGLHG